MQSKKADHISILIVDDEPEARDLLDLLLRRVEAVGIAGMAENVDDAMDMVEERRPELILLDIQMPGKNGFELVSKLREKGIDAGYIFVTAYDEYAIRAIRESAFDYLLKPVDPEKLKGAINRFREEWKKRIINDRIDSLLSNLGIGKRLKLNIRTGFLVIDPREIVYCVADGNYTIMYLADERHEIISRNLGSIENELRSDGFFRASRSLLINLRYLTHVDNKACTCRLQSDSVTELKVARSQLNKLNRVLG